MQQFVVNNSDDQNKNSSNSVSDGTNNHNNNGNSMPPQVQLQATTTMQQIQQPFQQQLPQFQNWDNSQQQHGDLLSIQTSLEPSTDATGQKNNTNRPLSPTNVSLESSSIKSNASSSRNIKGSQSSSLASLSKINSSLSSPTLNPIATPGSNATFSSNSGVKRGAGVDVKGPTPEVAQQLRFPWKLHLLLERCEYEHQQKLAAAAAEGTSPNRVPDMPISWLPTGKAFKVHDKERFVKEVMPSFFGTQSFKTFQRNLNLWGFTRVSKGPHKDVCSHPLFLKGFPAVCQSMKRIVLKGTGRGNRAPLGGVDVSSVQAVVAAAAMQQAQQQQAQQQHLLGQSPIPSSMGISQVPPHIATLQGQPIKTGNDGNTLNHINIQNPQQGQVMQNQYQQQQQQQQFVIENGTIQAAPVPSQQNLVVLPSAPPAPSSATTTVMWPNNQQQVQQQNQSFNMAEANATLQKSLSQLSTIIQQLNGCNAVSTAAVNNNAVQGSGGNAAFQQQAQQQLSPTPMLQQQQQQQPILMQQQQQTANPNAVVAPSPMSTQDLVTLLLQRNLQQQVSQAPNQAATTPIQLQVPSSLFPGQQTTLQQQQSNNSMGQGFQQQQGAAMFSQQQQQQPQNLVATPASTTTPANQQQQNQLLKLLLQQNGWSTSSAPI